MVQVDSGVEHGHAAQNQNENQCIAQIAHAGHQTGAHSDEDGSDLPGGAGGRAEADETECARYRYSRAHIAVDHHDDHTDNRGQKCQCDSKAFGTAGSPERCKAQQQSQTNGSSDTE